MKRIIVIISTLFLLPSCKKCYQCTVYYTQSGPNGGSSQSTTSVCGKTKKQIEQYQKDGKGTTTAHAGNVTITQSYVTYCK